LGGQLRALGAHRVALMGGFLQELLRQRLVARLGGGDRLGVGALVRRGALLHGRQRRLELATTCRLLVGPRAAAAWAALASASAVSRAASCPRTSLSSAQQFDPQFGLGAGGLRGVGCGCASRRRRTTSSSCTATAACHSARIASAISAGSSGRARSARPARTTSASMALSVRDSVAGSPPPRRSRSLRTDTTRRKRAAVGGAASPASVSMASTVARIWSGVAARRGMVVSERMSAYLTHIPNVRKAIYVLLENQRRINLIILRKQASARARRRATGGANLGSKGGEKDQSASD
jgi:hypothetical protein